MSDAHVTCNKCVFRRRREPLNPFRGVLTWTPGLYEAKRKWDEEQRELALKEKHSFQSGDEFDYEPSFFDWCEKWTQKIGRRTLDPVSGEVGRLYVLCARANQKGNCKYHQPM